MKKSSILLFISGVMFVIAAVFVFYALGPVSYTHLDVYKRQRQDLTGYSTARK